MRRLTLTALLTSTLLVVPALAEPAVTTSMPAIKATLSGNTLGVRLEQGVLGYGKGLEPRTLVIIARDAEGRVVAEKSADVSRRMTYARVPVSAAVAGASTVSVSVR